MPHLVEIDDSNKVVAVYSSTLPLRVQLSDRFVVAPDHVTTGWEFTPEGPSFTPPGRPRWITKLAFDNRFTLPEAVRLKLAQVFPARAEGETENAYMDRCAPVAQLQVLASRLAMASYVDLDRADTRAGVQALEQLDLLVAGRAQEILDGPIAPHEYHRDA